MGASRGIESAPCGFGYEAAERGPDPVQGQSLEEALLVRLHTHKDDALSHARLCRPSLCTTTNQTGYIGEFEIVDDHRANKIVIELTGRLNKCGVISPRFDVAVDEIEKWVVNLLPSRQFGHIVISTTYGIMTHEEARRKKTGGKILGFFY